MIARELALLKTEAKEEIIAIIIEKIKKLLLETETPTKIKSYGISKEKYMSKVRIMASKALLDTCLLTNPRQVLMKDLIDFYNNIYAQAL